MTLLDIIYVLFKTSTEIEMKRLVCHLKSECPVSQYGLILVLFYTDFSAVARMCFRLHLLHITYNTIYIYIKKTSGKKWGLDIFLQEIDQVKWQIWKTLLKKCFIFKINNNCKTFQYCIINFDYHLWHFWGEERAIKLFDKITPWLY